MVRNVNIYKRISMCILLHIFTVQHLINHHMNVKNASFDTANLQSTKIEKKIN
jgi:hypothetical protein